MTSIVGWGCAGEVLSCGEANRFAYRSLKIGGGNVVLWSRPFGSCDV